MRSFATRLQQARFVFLAALIPASSFVLDARQSREQLLVSAEWLKQHQNDAGIVILHVGDQASYADGHIAGAVPIQTQDLAAPDPADHMAGEVLELPAPEAARAKLESLGVTDRSRIVLYYGQNRLPAATRIAFTLDWLGLGERTSILDGGLAAWKNAGGAVTKEPTVVQPGRLGPTTPGELVVTGEWVNENKGRPGIALIDARAAVYYDGTEGGMMKRGHIPGARNLAFTTVSDDRSHFKTPAQLKQLFADAGVKPGDTVVAYCHIGMQATAVLYAARSLGYQVRLYDGSFHDWEKSDHPVQVKPAKASGGAGAR